MKEVLIKILAVLILTGLFLGLDGFVEKPKTAQAVLGFGGKILSVITCECNPGYLLFIGPPKGGSFLFQTGESLSYAWYQIMRQGAWTKGTYFPGGVCVKPTCEGECCPNYYSTGTILRIGTSLR